MHRGPHGSLSAVLFLLAACAGQIEEPMEDSASVNLQPIVGGVDASDYPEAVYINIDATPVSAYVCSGALIAPQVVLTAGHCVDSHSHWEVYVGGTYRSSTSSAVLDWNENGAATVNPAHHDLGLVFLDQPVEIAQYPTLAKTAAGVGAEATCVGRVLDGAVQSGTYKANTSLYPADIVGYTYDYMSSVVIQPGDSGGPVFLAGTHEIAAVNSGASSALQVLARVDLVRDWIVAQIDAHGGLAASAVGDPSSPSGETGSGSGSTGAEGVDDQACSGDSETEHNNRYSAAAILTSTTCGMIESAADADWFVARMSAGNRLLAIDSDSDAAMNVGIASRLGCIVAYRRIKSIRVNIASGTAKICVQVTSPSGTAQNYELSVN